MRFYVGNQQPRYQGIATFHLEKDNWNDWFKWYTLYTVKAILPDNSVVHLGLVKIGRRGMTEESGSTTLPQSFEALGDDYFSLGQDENYYETLISLGVEVRIGYLSAMRDCAYSLEILDQNSDEEVLTSSLLRTIEKSRVRERFHRLANGQVALSPYSFDYVFPTDPLGLAPPPVLTFTVKPNSLPATNIHVLIGRNGVGKTRCFDFLARAFLGSSAGEPAQDVGHLRNNLLSFWDPDLSAKDPGFVSLVTVSFSVFDSKGPLVAQNSGPKRYAYVGLVSNEPLQSDLPMAVLPRPDVKDRYQLAHEFAKSVIVCREGVRRQRWEHALRMLEADPLFAEANVSALSDYQGPDLQERARELFGRMSSGHAVVLLSITRLVELVEEKSLVLIDEPESHLHPPLLSAFMRALSDLLINRNGVAIIATHSPVVLQEVPASCVWKLSRSGHDARVDRPEHETFGENSGTLTREVFGLEVTQTGFHRLIAEQAEGRSYEQILSQFDGQLGAEGRALARALSLVLPLQASPPRDQD
ncbi:MAG: AAA family ATPase [Oligoflexus sp.]